MKLVLSPDAKADIKSLYQYIAEQSQSTRIADGYLDRILKTCDSLLTFPEMGRDRSDVRPNLRTIAFERRVVIAYFFRGDEVEIANIFYGGRDFESLLAEKP